MKLIAENAYRETMEREVEPKLAALREDIFLPLSAGGPLHAELYEKEGAVRAVVVLHGYTESAEKFREMIYYFLEAGFNVYAVDHRGHGQSMRQVDDLSITHIDHFHDYVDDLAQFMEQIVLPRTKNWPLTLYCHSMGGAIGGMALMEHPDWFCRAVLTAPMIAPSSAPYPRFAGPLLSRLFCILGKSKERAFIAKPFDGESETFEHSSSASRARFDYYHQKRLKNPLLQNCSPSYSWVRAGTSVTKVLLNPANCKKIKTPLLLCQAALDTTVLLPEQDQFVKLVPGAQLRVFKNAKHEIYGSDNDTMQDYVPAVLGFLEGKN